LHVAPGVALNGLVDCIHDITIEKDVFFGHDVTLLTGGHDYTKFGEERRLSNGGGPIYIEEGAWICSKAIIIGPCRIGKHAVIGAGTVVSKDVKEYTIVVGSPMKVLKEIPH